MPLSGVTIDILMMAWLADTLESGNSEFSIFIIMYPLELTPKSYDHHQSLMITPDDI
jgi:hypothetical protein